MKKKVSVLSQPSYRGRKVLVVGLGLHGGAASAIRWLLKAGAKVRVTDTKSAADLAPTLKKLQRLPVQYHLGGHVEADFLWADMIYQNQGVPDTVPQLVTAKRRGVPIINEITIFFERCPAMIIGVTGTRGKSTTTALLGAILKAENPRTFVSGNIRQQPMLDLLPILRPSDRVVLELSSFQLEYLAAIKRSPQVAIMTNLLVDHLNRYGSLSEYAAAKYNIFRWQKKTDVAILNYDSPWTVRAARLTPRTIHWFGSQELPPVPWISLDHAWVIEQSQSGRRKLFPIADWPLPGDHQRMNLLAAVTAARALSVSADTIRRTIKKFTGLAHRQEIVRTWRGHIFVNDTAATTPDATLAALAIYRQAVFIVGGTNKDLQFSALASTLTQMKTPLVFLPGSATDLLKRLLNKNKYRGRTVDAVTMNDAVRQAVAIAKHKQAIVLSPGAASFGLFQHEFDRGEQFVKAVKKLR